MKEDGWVLRMKYFQNVENTIRDLMTATAAEQSYKSGFHKDKDGFMDIDWVAQKVIPDWETLRETFQDANSRKAIAPTQFNHQSTRGHCIMTLELERPLEDRPEMKQIGRLYVCDLAGTEPAGDVVYAEYKQVKYVENGVEQTDHKYIGPHRDRGKTKELQDQGKKINLSLSEMATYFMKMAEAVQKKTLKPGKSIPGCNSYFLGRYLKDTMIQAKTYLFAAIRPEANFLNYTYSTLGFAKNASVIKLEPKKSTAGMSANEIKLMAELEKMKELVKELQLGGDSSVIEAALAKKQAELAAALAGDNSEEEKAAEAQRDEYKKRGISLMHFEKETEFPYFVNLDQDPYRSNRFMYIVDKAEMGFGPGGDFEPMDIRIKRNHCKAIKTGTKPNEQVSIVGGDGDTLINGKHVAKGEKVVLRWFDRLVIGNEVLLFRQPGNEDAGAEVPTADSAFEELATAIAHHDDSGIDQAALDAAAKEANEKHAAEMARLAADKEAQVAAMQAEFESKMKEMQRKVGDTSKEAERLKAEMEEEQKKVEAQFELERVRQEAARLSTAAVEADIRELIPKIKDMTEMCSYLDRGFMNMEVVLQGKPTLSVRVKVHNTITDDTLTLDKFAFLSAFSVLKDEVSHIQQAVLNDRAYEINEENDPVNLLMDNTVDMGTCTVFNMGLAYNIGTDSGEEKHDIKSLVPPFENSGVLSVKWTPMRHPEDEEGGMEDDPEYIIDDPSWYIGKPWTARLEIEGAVALPVNCELAYVHYNFNGQEFTTETVSQNTRSPKFGYSVVHHNPKCSQAFVEFLEDSSVRFVVSVNPSVQPVSNVTPLSTTSETMQKNMNAFFNNKKATAGGTYASVTVTKTTTMPKLSNEEAEKKYTDRIAELESKLSTSEKACEALTTRVKALELEVASGAGGKSVALDDEARSIFNMMDSDKNGALTPSELSYQLSDLGFPEKEIEGLFMRMDLNGDGKIELKEFTANFVTYQNSLSKYAA